MGFACILYILYLIYFNVQSDDLRSFVFKLCLSVTKSQHDREGRIQRWESLEEWNKITKMLIINSNILTLYHNKRSFRVAVYIFQDQIDSDNQVFLKSLNSLTN